MKRLLFLAPLVLALTASNLPARPLTLHVAPDGRDSWTGQPASVNTARSDGPLATLPAALRAARQARRDPAHRDDAITILLRQGTYELAEPILLTPEDSGVSAEKPFTLAAFPGETPLLSGGRRLTGWRPAAGRPGLWEAEIPAVREGRWYFRQLFINGQRKQRARSPNDGFYRIQGPSPQDHPVKIKFKPGEIQPSWAADGDVEVIALLAWADIRMQIRAVDEANHLATLSGNPRPSNKENNAQYYIENAPEALDQPGEWYLNRRTGILTYWPQPGEDLARAEVVAPQLEELVALRGDMAAQRAVRHVVFRGLTFSHTDYTLPREGYADTQAAIVVAGDVRAEAATDAVIESCRFRHLAGYGVDLGRGCQRWQIVGNEMAELGGGGVRLGESAVRQEGFERNHSHVVTDNHIHHVAEIFLPAVGVFIIQSGTNRIAHNHIHHLYYTAISVGWTWGYRESPCRANLIEYNHMHDLGQHWLSDMGAVYTLGPQPGTVVRNNLIHDVNSFTYGGWGLYTDEGSTGIVMENNVVYRCKSAGFHQHYGRENVIRNNLFAFSKETQVMRTRAEAHVSFYFTNNIVYFDSGNLLGSNWGENRYLMNRNVYFDTRLGAQPNQMKFAGATWEQWRARGHDADSVVADPMFENASRLDFRLKPGSPALKLGFKPIDLSRVGVREKAQRTPAP